MGDALSILRQEHRIIERALEGLERLVAALALPRASAEVRTELARFVRFIREFADELHHGKEEDLLFATLSEHGVPRDAGPVGVMLAEHGEARRAVGLLAQVAGASGPLDPQDIALIRRAAFAYTELMRGHIAKEDNVLYPMALRCLPAEQLEELTRSFESFDADFGVERRWRLESLVLRAASGGGGPSPRDVGEDW